MTVNSTLKQTQVSSHSNKSPCRGCTDRFIKVADSRNKYGVIRCHEFCEAYMSWSVKDKQLKQAYKDEADAYLAEQGSNTINENAKKRVKLEYTK